MALEVDGALSLLELARVDAHVACCADCHTFRRDVAKLTATLRDAPLEPFCAKPVRRYRSRVLAVAPPAAAFAAIVVALTSLFTATDRDRSTRPERSGSGRPAYYESTDYELGLLRAMIDREHGTHMRIAI